MFRMEINYSKGDRIILLDNHSQVFVGEIKSINKDLGRILLKNIVQQPGNIIIEGYRNFDRNEIVEIKKNEENVGISISEQGYKEKINNEVLENNTLESKIIELKKLQTEYQYIKDFNEDFHSAITVLKNCNKIGLYVENTSKGRYKRASIVAISSDINIFIFDLKILGDDLFNKGLKDILESPNIIKVVCDCRYLSDCLKHKHLIKLENVRDVEAEDIMVVHQQRNNIRKHSRSLEYLIKIYLSIDVDVSFIEDDAWDRRPLTLEQFGHLSSFVSYLIPLQEKIEKQYLQRLIDASKVYNLFIRELDICDFVQINLNKTLKKQMTDMITCQSHPRTNNYKMENNF